MYEKKILDCIIRMDTRGNWYLVYEGKVISYGKSYDEYISHAMHLHDNDI